MTAYAEGYIGSLIKRLNVVSNKIQSGQTNMDELDLSLLDIKAGLQELHKKLCDAQDAENK